MPLSYNSKYIIPAPFCNLQKSYIRNEDQGKINPSYKLTLTGKLLPKKGSPTSSGSFWLTTGYPPDESPTDNFDSLLRKQEAIRHLFAEDGKLFKITTCNTTTLECYPTIDSIQFSEGHWFRYIDYSVEMTANRISGVLYNEDDLLGNDFPQYLTSAKENWSLDTTDEFEGIEGGAVYNLTHSVNAVGYNKYGSSGLESRGWQEARAWVYPRLGFDSTHLTGTSGIGLPSYYTGYNYKRTEETDETGGSYSVNEAWTITSGNTIEDFNVDVRIPTDTYIVSVTAQGNIRGLESGNIFYAVPSMRYDNANTKYTSLAGTSDYNTIYTRAKEYSGYNNLNPQTVSKTIAKNPVAGTINYTWEYDTRPTNYVSGAIFENISIQDTFENDVYGQVVVLGRAAGPVLQDLGTVTSPKKSMTIDVVMPYYSGTSLVTTAGFTALYAASPKTQTDDIVNSFYGYLTGVYNQVFYDGDSDNWDIKTGHFSRQVSWTMGDCS